MTTYHLLLEQTLIQFYLIALIQHLLTLVMVVERLLLVSFIVLLVKTCQFFNTGYCNSLDELSHRKTICYIAGDYNINLLNCDTHLETDQFLNNAFLHYYFRVLTRPTRYCLSTSTLIDNIFTNSKRD